MSAITITISSPSRAIVADGRLVAGESVDISVVGGVPTKLYIVSANREVVAACESFVGGESSGTGVLNLATVPLAEIVSQYQAGRAVNLSCIVEDGSGNVIGYGFVPIVCAPMPDALEDLDVDLYLKASDIRALFANVPTSYPTQRSLSEALSEVVGILKNLGLAIMCATVAMATEWQDVPVNTIIGDGLTLTNGTISASGGGGGLSTNDVRAIVASATDNVVRTNSMGSATIMSATIASSESPAADWGIPEEGVLRVGYGWGHVKIYYDSIGWHYDDNDYFYWLPSESGTLVLDSWLVAATNGIKSAAYHVADDFATAADEALIAQMVMGSNVVAEVTNYNSRVHAPELRLLQLDHDTLDYYPVWTETNGLTRTRREATLYTDAATNALGEAKADRAWSHHTSALGADAPAGVTWLSTPETVIAGGYEYAKHVTSHGDVWILTSNQTTLGADTNGYFRLTDGVGDIIMSIEKTDSIMVGVDAYGISVAGGVVTIPLGVVSPEAPVCYATTSLVNATWTDISESTPSWITSAQCTGESGAWVWRIETTAPSAFFQFRVMQEGSTIIRMGAQTDLSGGIVVNGVRYYPHVNNGNLTWSSTP